MSGNYPAGVTDNDPYFNSDPEGVESAQEEWDRVHGAQYEAERELIVKAEQSQSAPVELRPVRKVNPKAKVA